jgi:hypothetical protein
MFLPKDGDRIQSPKCCILNKKTGQWIMSKNTIIILEFKVFTSAENTVCIGSLHHSVNYFYFSERSSTKRNAVFWDVAPCRSCVNRQFGGTYRLHHQGRKIRERGTSVRRWLQSETTCSRRFLACGLFYPEDGGNSS